MKRIACLALLFVLAVGCMTSPPAPPPGPAIAMFYYPYEESLARLAAVPEPTFFDWNEERMHHDLVRLAAADVNAILVCLAPADLRNRNRADAFKRFVELASRYQRPQVAVAVEAANRSDQDIRGVFDWLISSEVYRENGYFRWQGKPLVVLLGAQHEQPIQQDLFTVRRTGAGQGWYWDIVGRPADIALSEDGEQAMAVAGLLRDPAAGPEGGWAVPRRRGETLRAQLRAAGELQPDIICVASWNDFKHGHFIESNSLDGDRPYLMLQAEIERLRDIGRIRSLLQNKAAR